MNLYILDKAAPSVMTNKKLTKDAELTEYDLAEYF